MVEHNGKATRKLVIAFAVTKFKSETIFEARHFTYMKLRASLPRYQLFIFIPLIFGNRISCGITHQAQVFHQFDSKLGTGLLADPQSWGISTARICVFKKFRNLSRQTFHGGKMLFCNGNYNWFLKAI